jgi:hypothetical protein
MHERPDDTLRGCPRKKPPATRQRRQSGLIGRGRDLPGFLAAARATSRLTDAARLVVQTLAMAAPEQGDDGLLLPPLEDRRWLLEQLRALVAARGAGPLATALLVEPNPRFFPDRWGGGEASMRRLLLRLCAYAGLSDLQVSVAIYDAEPARRGEVLGKPMARGGQELQVWLAGLVGGELKVGVEASAMMDPITLVASAARVVSHAYRVVHGLMPLTGDAYDPKIDLTTVYLGFGLLSADAALRFTTRSSTGAVQSRRTPLRLGTLPPQALCYLLAAQVHVRGEGRAERQRIARGLQTNQAAFFRHAYAAIERMDPPIATQLGVPAREQWPAAPALAALTAPFPDDEDTTEPEARRDEDRGVLGMNVGKPVFIVDRSMAPRLGRVLFMGCLMLGGVASRMSQGDGVGMSSIAVIAVGLGLGGLGVGRLFRDRRCSEPKCGAPLRLEDRVCPRCQGEVVGTIKHPRERLAAEEAYLKTRAATTTTSPASELSETTETA